MWQDTKRLYNGEILLGVWISRKIENGNAVLDTPCGLRPSEEVQTYVQKEENLGYLETWENSKVTYELKCNFKRYSCIINSKRYSCIRFSKEILRYLIFKRRILLHREIHKLGSMPDFNRRIQHHHVTPKGNQSAIKNLTKSNECKSNGSWRQS